MPTIYDLVTSNDIVSYWTEKNANQLPLLGETLFPIRKRLGSKLEWVKGAKNQPVALKLSSYDAKAIRRDRKGIEKYDTEMPFFKESKYVDEKMRQDLNNMIASGNQAVIDQILVNIYDDEAELIGASDVSLERMRMEALTTGTITLSSNGQSYSYDYGVPAEQKKTVATSWADPSADIIGEISDYVEYMKTQGVNITRAVCNSSVAKYFRKNTAIKNAVYVFAGGTVNVTSARALDYIYNETGVRIYVYDNVYVGEDGNAVKYVPDDTFVMFPEGDLGLTNLGTTPEESDLMNKVNSADVALVNEGVAVTTSQIVDPVNVETKVSMVALPSFEQADKVMIVDTSASSI